MPILSKKFLKFDIIWTYCIEGNVLKNILEFEQSVKNILTNIGENPEREGLAKTPQRVAKAYEFMCEGYNQDPQEILRQAMFETSNDEMVLVRDIEFYSLCEHHMLPFFGKAHVAYIPNGKVVGLSKIPRVVNVFARRLQIQEQLTEQIAAAIMEAINPKGVGVVTQARHMCMEMRGVEKVQSSTLSSALRGQFMHASTRAEFFNLINTPYHKS
jgi:GTP cyclohydrolase I